MTWTKPWMILLAIGCGGGSTSTITPSGATTDTSSTTAPTSGTTSSPTTTLGSAEWIRVDDSAPGDMGGGGSIAIAPDGTLLVSWVDVGGNPDIHLARSTDGGATFEPSVVVDGAEEVVIDWWTGPALHTDGTDVVLVTPAREASSIQGMVWRGDLATLTFGAGQVYGAGMVEMISAAIGSDGDLWVAWLEYDQGAQLMLANSTLGQAGANVSDALGTPTCECCPIALEFSSDDRPLLAWRDNADNIRNIGVASGAPGAQTVGNQTVATQTDWLSFSCPVQGPAIAETDLGTYLLTWSDNSSGDATVYVARSTDFVAWDPEIEIAPDLGGTQQSPRIAVGPSGTIYLFFAESSEYWVTTSTDDGLTWADPTKLSVMGSPADRLDVAEGAGQLWVEVEADEQVWVVRVE